MEEKLKEFNKKDIIELLKRLGNRLKEEVTIFLIGGGNMSLRDIKLTTNDIDLIVLTRKEYVNLKEALISLGYNCHEETFSDDFYKTPIIVFLKDNIRIDVFVKNVSNQLELSEEMQKRTKEYDKYGNLKIMLVSNEDIFLFKSITDREKDVDDCFSLIRAGLNWEIIKKELYLQEGKVLWRFWIYEQIIRIKNKYGVKIPIENYVWDLVKEKWEKRPRDFMEDVEDERIKKMKNVKNKI
ncbi:MAG: hypothetical protein ISS82_04060 [Nanoarchaeota archaeon]|nr:hypothetical protein [Nanoarchaeota archaeon]